MSRTHPAVAPVSHVPVPCYNLYSALCDVSLGSLTISPVATYDVDRSQELPSRCLKLMEDRYDLGGDPPLVVSCFINENEKSKTSAMIDSGASTQFMDYQYARDRNLKFKKKKTPLPLVVVDGRPSAAGMITHEVRVRLQIDQHLEILTFQLTKLGGYDLILGKSWLKRHNPPIDWERNTISFNSGYCQAHCLPTRKKPCPEILAPNPKAATPLQICMVSAAAFTRSAKSKAAQLFAVTIEQIDRILATKENPDPDDREEEGNPEETLRSLIPPDYHDFLKLFLKKSADRLPPRRYVDHAIELEEGTKPPFGPLYNMSELELKALREYLEENLSKGFIRASKSSAASPVLFVKKPDGTLRFCVDYRGLNTITKKNRYPLPRIDETLSRLGKAKFFTRLDLRSAFNLIRIREGDEWKTAFRTRYGLFEYLVMSFGLTNAPATCQTLVNDTLREFLDIFCVVYLDDILIYSDDLESHKKHVAKVLEKLLEAGLFVKPEKCEFHSTSTTFLGFVISREGISMDPKKVKAVQEWETPTKVKDLQCFLGFANFYRRFIKDYSKICGPLFALLRKDTEWKWSDDCNKAFQLLIEAFCSAPILRHYDPEADTIVEVDASDSVVGGVLSQKHEEKFHPVAYYSRKMTPAECNYSIGDKELLAIVTAFKEWHQFLEGLPNPVTVYTDHANLKNFTTTMQLNRRQARWAQKLAEYQFIIEYREGSKNGKADALTRRSGDLPKEGDGRGSKTNQALLRPENFRLMTIQAHSLPIEPRIKSSLASDPLGQEIIQALSRKEKRHPKVALSECAYQEGLLYVDGLLYVPCDPELQCDIIRSRHDHPAAGHPGRASTFEKVVRDFWWPGMRKTITRYVNNCDTCSRIKPARHAPYGFLKPLTVPQKRWESVSMDFIVGLPQSEGFDAILVCVDRLTKMAHFMPCTSEIDSAGTAKLFRDTVFRIHGLPSNIVSDRGTQFTSKFSRALCKILNISQNLSTSFHPQTDGQTERINAILEQYLRAYCNYQQDNWKDLLTTAEFAYNDSVSSVTRVSPFFANYGQHPRYEVQLRRGISPPAPEELKDFSDRLDALREFLRAEMSFAQNAQAEFANEKRSAPPKYQVGDKVWLLRRHLTTTRPSAKLDFKRLGKFKILARVGTHAYKLELPPSMKVHPVFHVSLLEPAHSDPLPGQKQPNPPPVIIEGEEEYEVEEILDSRIRYRRLEYLVKWSGDYEPTWQPHHDLANSPALVAAFHRLYPTKPGGPSATARTAPS